MSADTDLAGARFTASRRGGVWVWDDDRGATIQIKAKGPEAPGVSLDAWAPPDAYTLVVAYGDGDIGEGHGTGGDGGHRDTGYTGSDTATDPATASDARRADDTATPADRGAHAEAHGHGDDATGDEHDAAAALDEGDADDAAADAAADAALDADIAAMLDLLGFEPDDGEAGGDGNGRSDQARDTAGNDGRSGDHAQDGSKDGREFEGRSDPGSQAIDDRAGGDKDAPDGRELGEEGGREGGVLGAPSFHFFGLQIAIPASLAGAVEVALILSEGNVASFGAGALKSLLKSAGKRGLGRAGREASVVAIRRELRRKASERVAEQMRHTRREIAAALRTQADQLTGKQRQLVAQWSKLTRDEVKRAQRITTWELQRRYFQSALEAARAEAKQLRRAAAPPAAPTTSAAAPTSRIAPTTPTPWPRPRRRSPSPAVFPSATASPARTSRASCCRAASRSGASRSTPTASLTSSPTPSPSPTASGRSRSS